MLKPSTERGNIRRVTSGGGTDGEIWLKPVQLSKRWALRTLVPVQVSTIWWVVVDAFYTHTQLATTNLIT